MLGRQVVYSALVSGRSITLGLSMIENIQTLNLLWYLRILIESLSNSVFERRTSTGSEVFSLTICLDAKKFVLISFFSLIRTIYLRVSTKPPSNDAKRPLPVDVCRSKTLLLKLPNGQATSLWQCSYFVGGLIINAKLPYLKYDCSLAVSGYSRVFIPAIIYFSTLAISLSQACESAAILRLCQNGCATAQFLSVTYVRPFFCRLQYDWLLISANTYLSVGFVSASWSWRISWKFKPITENEKYFEGIINVLNASSFLTKKSRKRGRT